MLKECIITWYIVDTQYMLVDNIILYFSLGLKVNWNGVHETLLAKNWLDLKNINTQKNWTILTLSLVYMGHKAMREIDICNSYLSSLVISSYHWLMTLTLKRDFWKDKASLKEPREEINVFQPVV